MTVPSETSGIEYSGNDATTVFAVPFPFPANGDLVVTAIAADESETVLAITTDYTVSGAGGASGNVTMLVAPATGTGLRIERTVGLTQSVNLVTQGPFPPATITAIADRLTMMAQQLRRDLDAVVVVDDAAAASITALAARIAVLEALGATTLAALQATALTWSALETFTAGIVASKASGNGIAASGGGSGSGLAGTGGATGIGVLGTGGATSGAGLRGVATAGNSDGVTGLGQGTGSGVAATGGATAGVGVKGTGGATSGVGVHGVGGTTDGIGVLAAGTGAGKGINATGGTSGFGGTFFGGSASGTALFAKKGNSSDTAAFQLFPQADPTTQAHEVGHMYVTAAGVLMICTGAGTPGTFVKVGTQT